MRQRTYSQSESVDFVIVGSGSAGGIMARELATAGFSVVVLEQGPWRTASDFRHDEMATFFYNELLPSTTDFPQTFRQSADETAEVPVSSGST